MMFRQRERKLAETGTYIMSSLILGSTLGYLLYTSVTISGNPVLKFEAAPKWEQATLVNDRFIVPIEIINVGHRTPVRAKFKVEDGGKKVGEIEVEYLGRRSSKIVYLTVSEKTDLKIILDQYQF